MPKVQPPLKLQAVTALQCAVETSSCGDWRRSVRLMMRPMVHMQVEMGNEMNKQRLALGMFAILLLSYVVNAMDRQLFSVLAPDVRKALGLSLPEIGLAATVFTLGMGVAGIPTGLLLGIVARRTVVILGLIIFSAATCLTAYAQGMPDLLLYRFVSGLGEAMQLTALLAIGTTYFVNHRALAASSLNFTFGIGAVIGPNLGAAILGASHWRMAFYCLRPAGCIRVGPDLAPGEAMVVRSRSPRYRCCAGGRCGRYDLGQDANDTRHRDGVRRPGHLWLSRPISHLLA
jgi:hypothetical protein